MAPRRPVPPGGPAGRRPGAARTAAPRTPARGTPARATPPRAGSSRAVPVRESRPAAPARDAEARRPRAPRPRAVAGRPVGRGLRRPPVVRPVTMLSGVLVILALLIAPYVRPWLAQRSQLAQGRADVVQLQDEVAQLQAERDRWNDPAYIREQARARLGMLNPGEIGYVHLDPAAPARATDPRSAAAAVPPRHGTAWYGTLWQSVVGAGATAPQPTPAATAPASVP
jgi:cell division protein FtsB